MRLIFNMSSLMILAVTLAFECEGALGECAGKRFLARVSSVMNWQISSGIILFDTRCTCCWIYERALMNYFIWHIYFLEVFDYNFML